MKTSFLNRFLIGFNGLVKQALNLQRLAQVHVSQKSTGIYLNGPPLPVNGFIESANGS
jgi:hypothetical protein